MKHHSGPRPTSASIMKAHTPHAPLGDHTHFHASTTPKHHALHAPASCHAHWPCSLLCLLGVDVPFEPHFKQTWATLATLHSQCSHYRLSVPRCVFRSRTMLPSADAFFGNWCQPPSLTIAVHCLLHFSRVLAWSCYTFKILHSKLKFSPLVWGAC